MIQIREIKEKEYAEATALIRNVLFSEKKSDLSESGASGVLSFLEEKIASFKTMGLYDDGLKAVLVYEEDPCRIILLAVKTDEQHKGYGSHLLQEFQKRMESSGYSSIVVHAVESAVGFYQRYGFESSGEIEEADGLKVQEMECLLQTYLLGQSVNVIIDHPYGSPHPFIADQLYPVNAGYILLDNGNMLEAYVIGIEEPLDQFRGYVCALIYRRTGSCRAVAAPAGAMISHEDIINAVAFEEQYYETRILYADGRNQSCGVLS